MIGDDERITVCYDNPDDDPGYPVPAENLTNLTIVDEVSEPSNLDNVASQIAALGNSMGFGFNPGWANAFKSLVESMDANNLKDKLDSAVDEFVKKYLGDE